MSRVDRSAGAGGGGGSRGEDLAECVRRAAAEYGARTGEQPRVEQTPSGTVRAYGPRSSPLGRAMDGLADVRELSYTAAEHHPLWPLLYHAADMAQAVLDRWDGGQQLGAAEISEMRWSLGVMGDSLDRLSGGSRGEDGAESQGPGLAGREEGGAGRATRRRRAGNQSGPLDRRPPWRGCKKEKGARESALVT